MIHMECDWCEERIPPRESGGCRIKLGRQEYIFHLCEEHQDGVLAAIRAHMVTDDRVVLAPGSKLK